MALSLKNAIEKHGLPESSAARLATFIGSGCLPLPVDITEAIEAISLSLSKLREEEAPSVTDARRFRRFEDAGKSLKHVLNLVQLLSSIGIGPILGSPESAGILSRPLYISLDLGLRQRRDHYHGYTLYQCIALKDNYFEDCVNIDPESETNDSVLSGSAIKIAEGGRYDDLVRRYRPPGNFGSTLLNHYTTAPIPKVSFNKMTY